MSFNVNTRLNNLQQQINAITNEGLTNPLQGVMDVNGKGLTNVNIIDGGNYTIELKTNNVGGIVLDNPLYTTSDITVNTLHYTALDPPINYNSITYRLIGNQTVEPTEGNINMGNDNPNSGFISFQSLTQPALSVSLSMGAGNNIMHIGFSSSSTETTPTYGVYIFCNEGTIQNLTTGITVPLPALTFNLDLLIIGTLMKVYVNGTEQPTMQSTVPNVAYYLNCNCYANANTEIQAQNISYTVNKTENLSDVLMIGNDAGGQNITGVGALTCGTLNYTTLNPPIPPSQWVGTATSDLNMASHSISGVQSISTASLTVPYNQIYSQNTALVVTRDGGTNIGYIYDSHYNPPTLTSVLGGGNAAGNQDITGVKNLTVSQLNYTTLNPAIPAATIPNLTQVLTAGAGAGNLNITGVNNISSIQSNSGYIVNTNSIRTNQLFTNTAIFPYGTTGSNYQMWATGDTLLIQQYKGTPTPVLTNQPIIITDSSSIVFNTGILALQNSYVLDSRFNTPSYKKIITNQQFNISSFLNLWGSFFSTPLYPKTVNPTYVNGLNYAELSTSAIEIQVSTKITLSSTDFFSVFLSTSPTANFDNTVASQITQPATQGASKITFISSATTTLYYYSQTPITNLYLNIRINSSTLQPLSITYAYAKISGILSGEVCSNSAPLTFEE
jgi:hypothetical protein